MTKKTAPPEHLTASSKAWWSTVITDFVLDEHHVRLLTLAAESWDRCQEAREAIDSLGLTFEDRFGQPKIRPEVRIEKDNRIAFARLVRELNLDVDPPSEPRTPRIAG